MCQQTVTSNGSVGVIVVTISVLVQLLAVFQFHRQHVNKEYSNYLQQTISVTITTGHQVWRSYSNACHFFQLQHISFSKAVTVYVFFKMCATLETSLYTGFFGLKSYILLEVHCRYLAEIKLLIRLLVGTVFTAFH